MQLIHSNVIPKAALPFPVDYLKEKTRIRGNFPDSRALSSNNYAFSSIVEAVLLKYCPKYCRSLCFYPIPQSQSVLSRIKQTKILENIEFQGRSPEKKTVVKRMKQLIRNKRKTFRSLPQVNCHNINYFPLDMCLLLPRIQNLKIYQSSYYYLNREKSFASRSFERKMLKFYGYFWQTLKYVRHLEISTSSENLWVILPRLESSKKFLNGLKSFRLVVDPQYPLTKFKYPRVLLQILLKNQDLLKHVTHIKFSSFYKFHYYGIMVKSILDCCSSLICLSFPIETEFISRPDLKHLTLAPLQSPQNVQMLTLEVDDIWAFIEAFEFPLLLRKLVLHLHNKYNWLKVWRALYPQMKDDKAAIQSYEKSKILLSFFEKFKPLALLTSFDLIMPLFVHADEVMNNFILPLLRALPKLENFSCQFSHVGLSINDPFEMSVFLNEIEHLKSFKIAQQLYEKENSIQAGDLVILFNPGRFHSFQAMTSVHIDTWISEDFDFKQFLKAFSAGLKEITLAKISLHSMRSFLQILKIFNNAGHLPSVRINLTFALCLDDFGDLKQLTSPLILAKNVSVTTDIYISSSEDRVLDPKDVEVIQNTFRNLKVNLTLVISQNYSERHRQILKNNIPCFKEVVKTTYNEYDYGFC